MDEPDVDPDALARSLSFIRQVNRRLGGTSAVLQHLRRWAGRWPKDRPITFLDVATGSADIPLAIVREFAGRGLPVEIVALDLHPTTIRLGRDFARSGQISFVRGDALALPLGDGSVDYALCSMFLHHLNEAEVLRVIGEMLRVARRGLIVNDLLRNVPAKVFIHVATLWADRIDQHDARVSVAKAWTKAEVLGWRRALDAPWLTYHRHLFSRFTLAGEKP